jgi:hypothetical protein
MYGNDIVVSSRDRGLQRSSKLYPKNISLVPVSPKISAIMNLPCFPASFPAPTSLEAGRASESCPIPGWALAVAADSPESHPASTNFPAGHLPLALVAPERVPSCINHQQLHSEFRCREQYFAKQCILFVLFILTNAISQCFQTTMESEQRNVLEYAISIQGFLIDELERIQEVIPTSTHALGIWQPGFRYEILHSCFHF